MNGRTLTPQQRAEFDAFAARAQALGLSPSPFRTGTWGRIDADGRFREVARVDVGEPGQPGFRGRTHIHVPPDFSDHSDPQTPFLGEYQR